MKPPIVMSLLAGACLVLAAACGSPSRATEPTAPEVPATSAGVLPLGSMSAPTALARCPSGFYPGSNCFQSVVSCPATAPLTVVYGYRTPVGTVKGTILMHDGGGGTTPFDHGPRDGRTFPESFFNAGYRVVQLAWASDWEDTGLPQKNIRVAACRPATLLKYVYDNVHGGRSAPGGMGALGHSGGTGALGYALSWYGAGDYLDKAMFSSGPVFSDLSKACEVPRRRSRSARPVSSGARRAALGRRVPTWARCTRRRYATGRASRVAAMKLVPRRRVSWTPYAA